MHYFPNRPKCTFFTMHNKLYLFICGRNIACLRCQATSKRTNMQCAAPAMSGKLVCRFHGGRSTGPRTPEGRARCGRRIHGNSTRQARLELSLELQQLAIIESIALQTGVIAEPSRGRKNGWRKLT